MPAILSLVSPPRHARYRLAGFGVGLMLVGL